MSLRALRWPFELAGVLCLSLVFCVLPRRVAHWLGRRLGELAYFVSPRSRRVALENLRLRLGVEGVAARRIARASLRQAGAAVADLLRAPRVTRLLCRRDVEIPEETWRALHDVRRGGKGVVLACAHLGNWEFANLAGPFSGLPPTTVIVRPLPNPWLDRLLRRYRGWTGQKVIVRSGAAMECLDRVRAGEAAAIVCDVAVPPDAGAAPVPFFGTGTFTTLAVGYVAAMSGAPVFLTWFEPLARGRYRFRMEGPIEAPERERLRDRAAEITRAVSVALEEAVRARPGAWAWWNKRWRIRPDGAPETDYPSYSVEERWLWPEGTGPRRDRG